MFCPQCRAEYRPEFTRCLDCDVELVEYVAPEELHELDYSDYVTVTTTQGQFEEAQINSFLESNGIPTRIRGEAVRRTYGITIDGLGVAQIMVPREFETLARNLLAKAEHGDLRIDDAG